MNDTIILPPNVGTQAKSCKRPLPLARPLSRIDYAAVADELLLMESALYRKEAGK